jgi:copper resistance protein D
VDEPLIWIRAIHFAATISTTGTIFFRVFVAEPAFHAAAEGELTSTARSRLAWLEWGSLAVALASGAAWLLFLAALMVEMSWAEAISEGHVQMVLADTDFGHAWNLRLLLGALLGACLFLRRPGRVARLIECVLAACFTAGLAWAGHAAGTPGALGAVHLASDGLHLVAASAWVGALVPLAYLLGAACRCIDADSVRIARQAVTRFSMLGAVSVSTLLATGIVNSWMLLGSLSALIETVYGRWLLAKVALFLVMLVIAAVNRQRLTPQLMDRTNAAVSRTAMRRIRNNSLIEAMLGAVVIIIVGLLGTISPISAE